MVKGEVEWPGWADLMCIYMHACFRSGVCVCAGARGFKVWQKVAEIGEKIVRMSSKLRG